MSRRVPPGHAERADCHVAPWTSCRHYDRRRSGNDVAIARDESMAIVQMWAELLGDEEITCRIVPARVGDTGLVPGQALWELRVSPIDARRARELLPGDQSDAGGPERKAGEGELAQPLDPDAVDAESRRRAVRWLVVAGIIFVVLMAWVILARVGR